MSDVQWSNGLQEDPLTPALAAYRKLFLAGVDPHLAEQIYLSLVLKVRQQ